MNIFSYFASMERKYITGYEFEYEVFSDGRVFSHKSKKFLKQNKCTGGYLKVTLCSSGIIKQCMVHRLVAIHFLDNSEDKKEVNHMDGNKENNCVSNLEWCTKEENAWHSINVLNNPKPPQNFLNKFGKDHNRSIAVKVIMPDGVFRTFGSGLEFTRETGLDHTSISWARNHKLSKGISKYIFKAGKMKGIALLAN